MVYRYNVLIWFLCTSICAYAQVDKVVFENSPRQLTIADYDKLITHYRYFIPDSAVYFVTKAIALAKHNKDSNGLAAMLNQQGMIKDNSGQFEESRQNYLTALALYSNTHNQKGIATETIRLGVVEMRSGNYDKATRYFLESLKVSELSSNRFGKMEALETIATVYSAQRKFDVALRYLDQAKAIDRSLPFSNLSLNILNEYGRVYGEMGEFDKAKANFEEGISKSNVPQYMGLNISMTNNLASVYSKQGFKAQSIKLQLSALANARRIKNYLREIVTLNGLAESYGKDDPQKALFYLKQAFALVNTQGSHAQKQAIDLLGHMADMYLELGNYSQAYLMKNQEYAIADKYFYQGTAKQIASLQMQYELDKSKAKVKELNFQNAQQRLESKVFIYIIVGVVVLLAIGGLFYNRTRRLNALLNKANTSLQETNSVKDKLFSVLAHDLRSPFVTIISLLSLINDDDDMPAADRKELIDMVSVTSTASLDILTNLLKWGEMQIKGIRLNTIDLNPTELIERNIAMLSASAGMKGIRLKNLVNPDILVTSDSDHFEFILRNLLSNAIKFTNEGGDIIVSSLIDRVNHEARFIVTDNGVGIEMGKAAQIFEMSNISSNGTKEEKGTSLGLLLCKEFIEANKGKIWVESEMGVGSRFIFSLKLSSTKQLKKPPYPNLEKTSSPLS